MTFSFSFLPDSPAVETAESVEGTTNIDEQPLRSALSSFRWISNVPELLGDRAQEDELVCDVINISNDGDDEVISGSVVESEVAIKSAPILRRVDLRRSSFADPTAMQQHNNDTTDPSRSRNYQYYPDSSTNNDTDNSSDLEPGVYEGGLKVWECSLDLVQYIRTHDIRLENNRRKALELGCGHGLPGIALLQQSLQSLSAESELDENGPPVVTFADYNDFVLQDATISNLVLNFHTDDDDLSATSAETRGQKLADFGRRHVRLAAGDWMGLLQGNVGTGDACSRVQYDIILAAETVYTEETARDTVRLMRSLLVPNTGLGLVATKRYYFGVGGGVDAFVAAATGGCGSSLEVKSIRVYDNGHGNIRELIQVRLMN